MNCYATQLQQSREALDEDLGAHLSAIDAKFRLCDGILAEMQQLSSDSPDAATSPGIPSPLFFSKIS